MYAMALSDTSHVQYSPMGHTPIPPSWPLQVHLVVARGLSDTALSRGRAPSLRRHRDERREQRVGVGQMLVELVAPVFLVLVHLDLHVGTETRLQGLGFQRVVGHHRVRIIKTFMSALPFNRAVRYGRSMGCVRQWGRRPHAESGRAASMTSMPSARILSLMCLFFSMAMTLPSPMHCTLQPCLYMSSLAGINSSCGA